MSTKKWASPESLTTGLSTELNSLSDNSFCSLSGEIDNSSGLYQLILFELYLASFTPGSGSPYVLAHIVYCADGTNYEKEPDGTSGDKEYDAWFPLEASVAQASRIVRPGIIIHPMKMKLIVKNASGADFASSGNTLKYARYNEQVV